MQLPWQRNLLEALSLNAPQLLSAINERRTEIRKHRDAKGDDRCWIDDYWVHLFLSDTLPAPMGPPPFETAMMLCANFYENRRADSPDRIPPDAIIQSELWDLDITLLPEEQLFHELLRTQEAIRIHRDSRRSIEDDRRLYQFLPERLPADFRLPPREEFLGEAKAPHAGCPPFWRSHQSCPPLRCYLGQWGPCLPKTS